jgi:hypothetical protein
MPLMLIGPADNAHAPDEKQPVVLPMNDVALAAEAATIAAPATNERTIVRIKRPPLRCPRIGEAVNCALKHNRFGLLIVFFLACFRQPLMTRRISLEN